MTESESAHPGTAEHRYGSYRVLEPLGSGGMSSVYRAVHVDTGHEVALKVLPPAMAKNPVVLQRFLREARSAESLEHPHIVSIYDRGLDQGRHYLVLEYVPGSDLHEWVQRRGPLAAAEAIRVIRDVAEGLEFASGRGLVHRDIKPSNILRVQSGEIKIIDLGLALQADYEDERVTREGTTVGTVDYMAPEQARDSRAASLQSDIYSLGCTFYYVLTGIPPYPGGDITDKLTRHVRSPAPDVRDLRPDVPASLAEVMLRMMAKRPEDRFASYAELMAELDRVVVDDSRSPSVALVPLDDVGSVAAAPAWGQAGSPPVARGPDLRAPSSIPEISLANLPPEFGEPVFREAVAGGAGAPPAVLPRTGAIDRQAIDAGVAAGLRLSPSGWIALSVLIGALFVTAVIAIDRLVRSPAARRPMAADLEESAPDAAASRIEAPEPRPPSIRERAPAVVASRPRDTDRPAPSPAPPRVEAPPVWEEPEDPDDTRDNAKPYPPEVLARYLPDWALAPVPSRLEGRTTVLRRVVESRDQATVSTLRMALDETRGTTEIADEGPFLINDFRVPGDKRLLRARPGFRPIIRIERPAVEAVRSQSAVIELKGKSLTLDSLDLILDVSRLPPAQDALFSCSGSSLTVRRCTITLVNPGNQPFTLVRADGSSGRGSRLRFENTLVRGAFSSAFDLGGGSVDVAVSGLVLLGSQGPIVRVDQEARGCDHRFSAIGSVLACRGPAFRLGAAGADDGSRPRPIVIRAFDSVFGRFHGAGIASVIAVESVRCEPTESVEWAGDRNLFYGWKGFFASGVERTVRIPTLSAFRSTWNGAERTSVEIPFAWPQPAHLDEAVPDELSQFVQGREVTLRPVALPGPFLGPKTLGSFATPSPPVSVSAALPPGPSRGPMAAEDVGGQVRVSSKARLDRSGELAPAAGRPGAGLPHELVFDADAGRWHGDLGAFLRENLAPGLAHARVRAIGSGPRQCSPVRLPDGLVLELIVDPPAKKGDEWLSWSPEAESTAGALLELRGGRLALSQLRLRADERATVEALIRVEDGDLMVRGCQLVAPRGSETRTRRLISFEAPSTKPRRLAGVPATTSAEAGRPTCDLGDSILITGGAALRADVGRGKIGLSNCALAAGTSAIELEPARVARSRFDADLWLSRCTIASEQNVVKLGPWPGRGTGPDRPWLISTDHCAFLGTYDRRASETVLLRADEEAMAGGTVFWQAHGDAYEVDVFTAAGSDPPPNRPQDVLFHWINFWGSNHIRDVTGPRGASTHPTVRPFERLRPGRVDPADLVLDPAYHPGRARLDVGADLARLGVVRRPAQGAKAR
jgi:serine/threonine-protein kinase